jgi:hypothetical protein
MKWFVFMGEMGRRSLRPQSFSLVLFSTNKNKTKKKKKKKTWILSVYRIVTEAWQRGQLKESRGMGFIKSLPSHACFLEYLVVDTPLG